MLATLILAAGLAGSAPASAEEDPAAAPPGPAASGFITAPAEDAFIPQNSVIVTGTKDAGSTVAVIVPGGAGCVSPASDQPLETWTCTTALPNGAGVVITATETLVDATVRQSTVTVDVLGPPTIDSTPPQPAPGAASGMGLKGATITLLVDGVEQPCNSLVAPDGRWLCTIANGAATYKVQARQSHPDIGTPRGTSSASRVVTLVVQERQTETPAPVTPPPAKQAPVLPPPPVAPDDVKPAPSPSQTPDDRADAPTLPWLDRPIFPGPGGEGTTIREALTNWGTPTGFGATLPTLRETVVGGNWVWAPLLALLFVGLVALPLRMLATAMRGRFAISRLKLTGRNRVPRAVVEDPVPRNPWLMGLVPLAATAGLIVLAEGMNGEVRYLRLLFAVGVGLAILNVVGVAVTTRFTALRLQVGSRLRFLPILLLAAAIATLLSRLTGLESPLVGGVLIGAGFALGVPARPRAVVNLAQVGTVLTLAVLAWLAHGWLGEVVGFWPSVLSEMLATLCLAGVGSSLVLMLPLGALPGRVVLEWSATAWFAGILVVGTLAAAIILGGANATFPILASTLIFAGIAAVCVAVWAWVNYVEASHA